MRTLSICKKCNQCVIIGNPFDSTGARDTIRCRLDDSAITYGLRLIPTAYIKKAVPKDCKYKMEHSVSSANQCLNCEEYKLLLAKCIVELESCEETMMKHTNQSIADFIYNMKTQMRILEVKMEKKCWGE